MRIVPPCFDELLAAAEPSSRPSRCRAGRGTRPGCSADRAVRRSRRRHPPRLRAVARGNAAVDEDQHVELARRDCRRRASAERRPSNGNSNCSSSQRVQPDGIEPPYRSHKPMRTGSQLDTHRPPALTLRRRSSARFRRRSFCSIGSVDGFAGMKIVPAPYGLPFALTAASASRLLRRSSAAG